MLCVEVDGEELEGNGSNPPPRALDRRFMVYQTNERSGYLLDVPVAKETA